MFVSKYQNTQFYAIFPINIKLCLKRASTVLFLNLQCYFVIFHKTVYLKTSLCRLYQCFAYYFFIIIMLTTLYVCSDIPSLKVCLLLFKLCFIVFISHLRLEKHYFVEQAKQDIWDIFSAIFWKFFSYCWRISTPFLFWRTAILTSVNFLLKLCSAWFPLHMRLWSPIPLSQQTSLSNEAYLWCSVLWNKAEFFYHIATVSIRCFEGQIPEWQTMFFLTLGMEKSCLSNQMKNVAYSKWSTGPNVSLKASLKG